MTTQATLVIQFGTDADSSAVALIELDDIANDGKTSFSPGDTPYFLVHYDKSKLRIDHLTASSGGIQSTGTVTRERTQELSFATTEKQDLPYIPESVTFSSFGAGSFTSAGRSVTPTGGVPCIGTAVMQVSFQQYVLNPPALALADGETYSILIVVYMEPAV